MNPIRSFEDLNAWKKARSLTNQIYDLTIKGDFSRDFGLKDQIRRAAVSIGSNIAEGYERDGDKEFVQFLYVAKGSCGEVRAQLYIARDRQYLTDQQFNDAFGTAMEVNKMISGLIKYLHQSRMSGKKYKPQSPSEGLKTR
jgi:four helix bundle protein